MYTDNDFTEAAQTFSLICNYTLFDNQDKFFIGQLRAVRKYITDDVIWWRYILEQNVFAYFLPCLFKLYMFYHIKQIDFIFSYFCNAKDHRRRQCMQTTNN